MKKLTTAFILLLGMSVTAHAEDFKIPHVSVFGTTEIRVVPDEMIWSLSISTKGKEVEPVAAEHDQKVARMLKFLRDQKIEEKDMKISRIRLAEDWVHRNQQRIKEGYEASTSVTFKSKDLEKYRSLWLGVSKLPDTSVTGISFDTSQRIKYQNASRVEAIKVAKEKALALVKAAGTSLGEPILIEEQQGRRVNTFLGNGGGVLTSNRINMPVFSGVSDSGVSLAPGTIAIKTSVQVKFRISTH